MRWERARLVCALLALLVPWAAYVSHVRDIRHLRALEAHGELVSATVTAASKETATLEYAYGVDGARYTGSVGWPHVPYVPGESIVVYYLPDSPQVSWPGALLSDDAIALEAGSTATLHAMTDLFVLFAAAAAVADAEVRRRRRSPCLPWSRPATAGRLAALAALGAILAANLGTYATSVQKRALGAMPGGVPSVVLAPLLEAALVLPFFWVLPLVATYVYAGEERIKLRARPLVLLGLGYALILVAALVAFTGGGSF